jgi:uncharacterized protein DUF6689
MELKRTPSLVAAAVCLAASLVTAATLSAQTSIPLTVSGNQVTGTISLPGDVAADLTITFETTTGLDSTALEASARLIGPEDTDVLSRIPGGLSLPSTFPVLLTIGPSESSTLTFTRKRIVQLYTYNLVLDSSNPLSLFCAHDGGSFEDVTKSEQMGSYRVDGSGGGFSEFVIVRDTRLIDPVIVGKFDAVQTILNGATLPLLTRLSLQNRLDLARAAYLGGKIPLAITNLNLLAAVVQALSPLVLPDVWRAHDDSVVNVAGNLLSAIDTLKFSLTRKANGAP